MVYQKHIPKFPLDSYIDSIIYIEGNNKGTGLPKTAMSLVFNLEDHFKLFTDGSFSKHIDYQKFWVAGLQTKPTHVESYGISRMFLVQFKALGAFAFIKDPLHYYSNEYITLDHVFHKEADETWEKLQEANSLNHQFAIIESFLFGRISGNKLAHPKRLIALGTLFDQGANLTIHDICHKLNISRKHLNHLLKEYAGVSPKTLSSLFRLQRSLKTISRSRSDKLTNVAYQLGYFDQSHFINDFKRFTDLKPKEYTRIVDTRPSLKVVPHFIPFGSW